MTFKEQIELYLAALPSKWKKDLTEILCSIREQIESVDCEKVKECETLTSLSDFTVDGNTVSITYKDEKGVSFIRTFNLEHILNQTLEDLDPNCLTSQQVWDTMDYKQRIQLLIDSHCDCCSEPGE